MCIRDSHSFRPVGSSSCFVVGVIGGADGPTAVIYGTDVYKRQQEIHCIMVKDYCAIIGLNQKDIENQGILA